MKEIIIKGAKKNNLQNLDLKIPKNKITAVTGVSGSGKSTLVFDIIYHEGSTRYLEAVSNELSNAVKERNVDYIEGLNPTIALRQTKSFNNNPRSCVATLTDIATYLRILFSDKGVKLCPKCGKEVNQRINLCPDCHAALPVFGGAMFSYNTKEGMCPCCSGMGMVMDFSIEKIIPRPDLPVWEQPWGKDKGTVFKYVSLFFETLALEYGYDYRLPYEQLNQQQKDILLYGTGNKQIKYHDKKKGSVMSYVYPGIIPHLSKAYRTNKDEERIKSIEKYMEKSECPECNGRRFRKDVLNVKYGGLNIAQWFHTEVGELSEITGKLLDEMKHNLQTEEVTWFALNEINKKLYFLKHFGLDYLTPGRITKTLSGGELQLVKLANCMGTNLGGLIYILDEPTASMHERDKKIMIEAMRFLQKEGNTVIIVEHNKTVISGADFLVDMGPGGGSLGGKICYADRIDNINSCKDSLTCKYLSGEYGIAIPEKRRKSEQWIGLDQVNKNNLKDLSVKIPLNEFVVVTGVSGSGKSTLIREVLYNKLKEALADAKGNQKQKGTVNGCLKDVVLVDQTPIGRMSRSNLATYIGVFDEIRKVFANLPQAKEKHITAELLSFNVPGGRCEECKGMGMVERNVYFVHEVLVKCPECDGKRYKEDILSLEYKGKNLSEVLEMTAEQAYLHFQDSDKICRILKLVIDVGLGYMKLGQEATSFSGGEAQRIKLTKYMAMTQKAHNILFLLDEPTVGLHFDDIRRLLELFNKLVDNGNSIICIEHNMDVIKSADYIIDIGPDGGKRGGKIVCTGTPEEIRECKDSYTGKELRNYLCKYPAAN